MASLVADPPAAQVPATGGVSVHQLVNIGTTRLAFKVKSSNNSAYRLKPVFGFVDAGAATEMEITRLRGPPKEDKLLIQYAEVPADATDAQATFKPGATANEVVIRVTAK
ncbi:Protein SSP-35 [Aphelenchoides avenae]|nr:Protein SSP-35 [Aphelenchus avenae]